LSEKHNNDESPYVHLESGMPIFTPALKDPDPQKRADRESEKSYKEEQNSLQRKIFWTQVGLAVFGLFGIGVSLWQAKTAQESADTSDKAIILAQKSEREARLMSEKQLAENQAQFGETLRQMKEQAGSARLTAENALAIQRPWLRMSLRLARPLTIIKNGYDLSMIPTMNNIGTGVATQVSSRIEFRIPAIPQHPEINASAPHPNTFEVAWMVRDWCKKVKPSAMDLRTYFPADRKDEPQWDLNILDDDMKKSRFVFHDEARFEVLVYACVLYKFEPFPEWHHTAIVYQLSGAENGMPYLLKPKQTYTLDGLFFAPFPFAPEWGD
jgi:hypothetical protein